MAAKAFKQGVLVSTHTFQNKKYRDTFIGKEAIDYMVESKLSASREDAIILGQSLIDELNLFETVRGGFFFEDSQLLYRYKDTKESQNDKDDSGIAQKNKNKPLGGFRERIKRTLSGRDFSKTTTSNEESMADSSIRSEPDGGSRPEAKVRSRGRRPKSKSTKGSSASFKKRFLALTSRSGDINGDSSIRSESADDSRPTIRRSKSTGRKSKSKSFGSPMGSTGSFRQRLQRTLSSRSAAKLEDDDGSRDFDTKASESPSSIVPPQSPSAQYAQLDLKPPKRTNSGGLQHVQMYVNLIKTDGEKPRSQQSDDGDDDELPEPGPKMAGLEKLLDDMMNVDDDLVSMASEVQPRSESLLTRSGSLRKIFKSTSLYDLTKKSDSKEEAPFDPHALLLESKPKNQSFRKLFRKSRSARGFDAEEDDDYGMMAVLPGNFVSHSSASTDDGNDELVNAGDGNVVPNQGKSKSHGLRGMLSRSMSGRKVSH